MNQYRGISILPLLAKIFEKVLANQIKDYFIHNNLLFSGQHGFREAHSCESALHGIISKCLKNLDNKKINALLFVDFKKAFDMVDQSLLLFKLANYGFDNKAIKLIKNYFTNRTLRVNFGTDGMSDIANLTLGVGQGSVLGPLFFVIFINDLPDHLTTIETKLFADDTTLIVADECILNCDIKLKRGLL